MGEYTYKKQYMDYRDRVARSAPQTTNNIPNSVLQEVFAGRRRATDDMVGHRQNIAPSVQAKMSRAFGMDFSNLQVYRSDAMAGTSMHGMAQGNRVVIGSDVNLNTLEGQSILGHELSHVRAQSMGIGSGHGLLNDAALEHQADTEGAMAARGMSVEQGGMTMGAGLSMGLGMAGLDGLTPVGGGMSANAGAPMQAKGSKGGFFSNIFGKLFGKKKEPEWEVCGGEEEEIPEDEWGILRKDPEAEVSNDFRKLILEDVNGKYKHQ